MKYFWGLGKALLFANEPYFSEGTLRHVVANEQALKHEPPKLTVTAEQGLQSINENFGDIEKELHHLAGESFATIAIKSSKYLGRFTRAIDITVKELEKSSSDFGKLKKSKAFKLLLKQKNALQSIEAELLSLRAGKPLPKKAKSHDEYVASLFNGQKALHRIKEGDDLRHFVEKIALYVNGTFRPLLWSGLKEEALSRMHESIEL